MAARDTIFLPAHKTLKVIGGAVAAQVSRNDNAAIGQVVSTGNDATFGPYDLPYSFTLTGPASCAINDQPVFEADTVTGDYTILATDAGKLIKVNASSAVTITLPASLSEGFGAAVMQVGTGAVSFVAASGATMVNSAGADGTAAQYAIAGINIYANADGATAAWVLSGDVA